MNENNTKTLKLQLTWLLQAQSILFFNLKARLFSKSIYSSCVVREAHKEHEEHVQAGRVLHEATPLLHNYFHSAAVASVLLRWRHTEEAGDEVSPVLGHRRHFARLVLRGDDWHHLSAGVLFFIFRFIFVNICVFW